VNFTSPQRSGVSAYKKFLLLRSIFKKSILLERTPSAIGRSFGLLIVPLIVISEYAAALLPSLLYSEAFLNLREIAGDSYPP